MAKSLLTCLEMTPLCQKLKIALCPEWYWYWELVPGRIQPLFDWKCTSQKVNCMSICFEQNVCMKLGWNTLTRTPQIFCILRVNFKFTWSKESGVKMPDVFEEKPTQLRVSAVRSRPTFVVPKLAYARDFSMTCSCCWTKKGCITNKQCLHNFF